MSRRLIPVALGVFAALLYLPRLGEAPAYMSGDEVIIALDAHLLATTGRDAAGRLMPLYIEHAGAGYDTWFPPILFYAIALADKTFGFSEATVRLPMALAGIASIVLMYFIGRQLFRSELLAILSAVLLALTPAHFIHSRFAMDYLCPVPFALGWLLCVLRYCEAGNPRLLFAAGLVLGIGFYSYVASMAVMPMYALLTGAILVGRREPIRRYVVLAVGFAIPLLPFGLWLLAHPGMVGDHLVKYRGDESSTLVGALSRYAEMLHPRFLFVDGAPKPMFSTRLAGVLLVPLAGVLALGVWRTMRNGLAMPGFVLLAAFLATPIVVTVVPEQGAIFRAMPMVPFGVLLAMYGVDDIQSTPHPRAGTLAFLASWAIVIGLLLEYHDVLPRAQTMIRASTVPVALAGLAVLLAGGGIDRKNAVRAACVTLAAAVGAGLAYYVVEYPSRLVASSLVLALTALAALLPPEIVEHPSSRVGRAAFVALASCAFLFFYTDYDRVHRVLFVPTSAMRLAARTTHAAAFLVCAAGLRVLADRVQRRPFALLLAALGLIQIAYALLVQPADGGVWLLEVSALLLAILAVAAAMRNITLDRARFGQFAAVSLLVVAALQFADFRADYFGEYQSRSSRAFGGNGRGALERVIARAGSGVAPSIYIDPASIALWKFYLIKHQREDLLSRTVPESPLSGTDVNRVRHAPAGSLLVAFAGSGPQDRFVDELVRGGELHTLDTVRELDGSTAAWILQRPPRPAR